MQGRWICHFWLFYRIHGFWWNVGFLLIMRRLCIDDSSLALLAFRANPSSWHNQTAKLVSHWNISFICVVEFWSSINIIFNWNLNVKSPRRFLESVWALLVVLIVDVLRAPSLLQRYVVLSFVSSVQYFVSFLSIFNVIWCDIKPYFFHIENIRT